MNDNKEYIFDERIARYMKGEMSEEETLSFEQKLKTNYELRAKAIVMARMAKAMKSVGQQDDQQVIDAIQSVKASAVTSMAKKISKPSIKLSYRRMSLAASVVILICVGLYYNDYRATVSLGEKYSTAFVEEQSLLRGATSTDVEEELQTLYANVQNGENLKETIHRLSILWELSTMDTYNDYTDHGPYIGWNLACAELMNGENDKSKAILEELLGYNKDNKEFCLLIQELLEQL